MTSSVVLVLIHRYFTYFEKGLIQPENVLLRTGVRNLFCGGSISDIMNILLASQRHVISTHK